MNYYTVWLHEIVLGRINKNEDMIKMSSKLIYNKTNGRDVNSQFVFWKCNYFLDPNPVYFICFFQGNQPVNCDHRDL